MNVKNLGKSTKLREFLKLHSVLKFTTSSGKKIPNVDNSGSKEMSAITTTLLLYELKAMATCTTEPA